MDECRETPQQRVRPTTDATTARDRGKGERSKGIQYYTANQFRRVRIGEKFSIVLPLPGCHRRFSNTSGPL